MRRWCQAGLHCVSSRRARSLHWPLLTRQPASQECTRPCAQSAAPVFPVCAKPDSEFLPVALSVPTTPQGGRGGRSGPGAAGSYYGSARRGRPPAYNRPQRYDKDKFLQANFRFLVSGVCVTCVPASIDL